MAAENDVYTMAKELWPEAVVFSLHGPTEKVHDVEGEIEAYTLTVANASGSLPARSRASAAVGTPPRPRRAGHPAAFSRNWPGEAARRNAGSLPRPPASPAPRPTPSTSQNTPNSAADRAASNTSKSRNLEANPSENLSSFLRGFVCPPLSDLAPNARPAPQAACCPSDVLRQAFSAVPTTPAPRRNPNPRIASHRTAERISAIQRMLKFLHGYREAFTAWRNGHRAVLFPAGTYALRIHARVACAPAVPA